jgi:nitrite reductase/ring-hydroxylating ferredoxin subunit
MAVGMASAWLGGHLSFGRGVGVDQTVFEDIPEEWTPVADEGDLAESGLVGGSADGTPVLVARQGGVLRALLDRCSHRGCSLHEGTLGDGTVTCPCHGSVFRLEDGSVVKGPATAPQPRLEVRVRDGRVEVRAAS